MATTRPFRSMAAARAMAAGSGCSESISTKSVATRISSGPDGLGDIDRHLVSSEGRAQLNALHHFAHARGHLLGDRDAFGAGFVGVVHFAHPLHEIFRDGDTQLIHHELGVAVAGERPDSADYGDLEAFYALEELFEQV